METNGSHLHEQDHITQDHRHHRGHAVDGLGAVTEDATGVVDQISFFPA
jgi:hypothetical protein